MIAMEDEKLTDLRYSIVKLVLENFEKMINTDGTKPTLGDTCIALENYVRRERDGDA